MITLPNTGGELAPCPSDSPYWQMTGSPAKQVNAILSFLNAESIKEWFGNSPGSAEAIVYYTPRHWQKVVAAAAHATFDPHGTHKVSLSYNDLHCNTCDLYVSKELDHEHWDDLCSSCYQHADQCSCCEDCSYSPCQCCEECGKTPGWCECCSYCGSTECECSECSDCGNVEYNCSCGSSGHLFGQTKIAPWTIREGTPLERKIPTMGECQNSNIDPIQAAANYYLLDAIRSGVRMSQVTGTTDGWVNAQADLRRSDSMLSAITVSAQRSFDSLVKYLTPSFLAYAVAAVGGELRYHRSCSNKALPGSRTSAWNAFTTLVQDNGADLLFDANVLFLEFGDGAYGGKRWGDAAKIVGMFLKDKMPDSVFCDRVFALQHNGGCFLNKVTWARRNARGWSLDKMLTVLNAHAADDTDWAMLLSVATPEVRQMFELSDRSIRRVAKRFGGDLPRIPAAKASRNRYEPSAAW